MRLVGISISLALFSSTAFAFVLVSFAATAKHHYDLGSSYSYAYTLKLELNEPTPNETSSVGYKLLARTIISPLWASEVKGTLVQIQVENPQLQIKSRKAPLPEGFRDHSSQLDNAKINPIFVLVKDGGVEAVYAVKDDEKSILNIKKGIANLLQFKGVSGNVIEKTPLGKCSVMYENKDTRHVKKFIAFPCEPPKIGGTSRYSKVLQTSFDSKAETDIFLSRDTGVLEEVQVAEEHLLKVNLKKDVGASIKSSQVFKFEGLKGYDGKVYKSGSLDGAIKEIEGALEIQLIEDSLAPTPYKIPYCEANLCKSNEFLKKSLTVENMATTKAAAAFLQLVPKLRESTTEEIISIINEDVYYLPQLLDGCAAVGTIEAHRAAMKFLDFKTESAIENPERYLLGLSLTSNPSPDILANLFDILKNKEIGNKKLEETLLLTLAAMTHTITEQRIRGRLEGDLLILEQIEDFLKTSLPTCSDSDCEEKIIRGFKNLQRNSTVSFLFNLVETKEGRVGVVAMKALHSFPDHFIPKSFRKNLLKIVIQIGRKFDSSARTLAVDMILRNSPTKEEVTEMLDLMKRIDRKDHAEVSTFLFHRLLEFSEGNEELGIWLREFIDNEKLKNYHHLAHRGLSTAFSRSLAVTQSGNSTFSNAIEMTGKILKRSSFDVYLNGETENLQLLSLGIFAGGLSSFASSNGEEAEEATDDPATAGMELTIMGVQMRPIIFFSGKGELMGLVWSGAGSERTTALQGNVLLQDERKEIPLISGLVAEVLVQGGLSFDLAGQIQVSLWHRTANSLVENKAGLVLQSTLSVDTSFVRSRVDLSIGAEAALHFTSDISFYEGVLMCLKLSQPQFTIKQNLFKTERIAGSKHRLRKAKYITTPVSGLTYALNRKNSQLCGTMYKEEL